MKRLLIGLGAIVVLVLVTPDAMGQRRGNGGGGQGRGARGFGMQHGSQNGAGSQFGTSRQLLGNQSGPGKQNRQTAGALGSTAGVESLQRMWEEEKLARDVYTNLAKTSRQRIFRNIANAESQHMLALERRIRAGGANQIVLNNTPGVFSVAEYQKLYETLVAAGNSSPLDAFMVGAKIEEMDIADLQHLQAQAFDPQTRQVMEQLMKGSQNHLRAFASQIASHGATYKAEFLSQNEFDLIANAGKARGRGNGRGPQAGSGGQAMQGQGRGQHGGQGLGGQGLGGQGLGGQGLGGQGLGGQGLGGQGLGGQGLGGQGLGGQGLGGQGLGGQGLGGQGRGGQGRGGQGHGKRGRS